MKKISTSVDDIGSSSQTQTKEPNIRKFKPRVNISQNESEVDDKYIII